MRARKVGGKNKWDFRLERSEELKFRTSKKTNKVQLTQIWIEFKKMRLCLNHQQSPTVGTYCRLWPNVGCLVLCTKQPTLDCVTIKVLKWMPNSRVMYTMRTNVPKTFSVLNFLINLLSFILNNIWQTVKKSILVWLVKIY